MTIVMKTQTIAAGEFKAKCLHLLDEVQQRHKEIIVTKRGKAVARLVPYGKPEPDEALARLRGTLIGGDRVADFTSPLRWNAARR